MAQGFITGNLALDLAGSAWMLAQICKIIVNFCLNHNFDFRLLVSSGGMPSSHSALVCALAASVGSIDGVYSTYFALAMVLALVVMYDACNVRRAAGEQAKILNYIMERWAELSPTLVTRELKELLGHTPFQVIMGAILGTVVGIVGCNYFGF